LPRPRLGHFVPDRSVLRWFVGVVRGVLIWPIAVSSALLKAICPFNKNYDLPSIINVQGNVAGATS
jgi:hypothetical protein